MCAAHWSKEEQYLELWIKLVSIFSIILSQQSSYCSGERSIYFQEEINSQSSQITGSALTRAQVGGGRLLRGVHGEMLHYHMSVITLPIVRPSSDWPPGGITAATAGALLCSKCSAKEKPIMKCSLAKPVRVCDVCSDLLTLGVGAGGNPFWFYTSDVNEIIKYRTAFYCDPLTLHSYFLLFWWLYFYYLYSYCL